MKNQYIRGNCLKRRNWAVCRFKEGLARKREVVFLRWGGGGVDTPMHTMLSIMYCLTQHDIWPWLKFNFL